MLQVVWFKRDLRIHDHAALFEASKHGPILPLYIFEPAYWKLPDSSERHLWWITQSLKELRTKLADLGQPLVVRTGEAISILEAIKSKYGRFSLHAHQETGNDWTFRRDSAVHAWCKANSVTFSEYKQFGVIRGKSRPSNWAQLWENHMSEPEWPTPKALPRLDSELGEIPNRSGINTPYLPGEDFALETLNSFLTERCRGYRGGISSPLKAETAGSRLSPYITWGNISLRRVLKSTRDAYQLGDLQVKKSLSAFESRLHWHCHFIQKLECDPELEFKTKIRSMNTLRDPYRASDKLNSWMKGYTGYPLVDACMRSLISTGWINFRMRAMITSFASYHLLQDWRDFAHYLGKLFIDYEPGIHYSQLQMQSGTTGLNAVRIYDPVKQSYDQDKTGEFILRWVPELREIPKLYLHEPWKYVGKKDYPDPIVNNKEAAKKARDFIFSARKQNEIKEEITTLATKQGFKSKRRKTTSSQRAKDNQLKMFE